LVYLQGVEIMVAATGTTYERQDWVQDLLVALGNQDAKAVRANPVAAGFSGGWETGTDVYGYLVRWVIVWTTFESAANEQGFNLLKTTQQLNGSTAIAGNSAGVQIFNSYADGIAANVKVLQQPNFGALNHALVTGDLGGLGINWNALRSSIGTPAANVSAQIKLWNGNGSYSAASIAGQTMLTINVDSRGHDTFPGTRAAVGGTLIPGVTDPLAALGSFFTQLTNSFGPLAGNGPPRALVGLGGGVLILIGLLMAVKQIAGVNITQVAGKASKLLI
jgi:hypothetical protein